MAATGTLKGVGRHRPPMVEIDPPTERHCERCGRQEVWSEKRSSWVVDGDAEEARGRAHCLHDWNINGAYNPLAE